MVRAGVGLGRGSEQGESRNGEGGGDGFHSGCFFSNADFDEPPRRLFRMDSRFFPDRGPMPFLGFDLWGLLR
jgi:hypothetical protein